MQKIGFYRFNNLFRFLSAVFIYISVIVNIWGRVVLKANWSNQIRIRKEHELVTNGPFRFVRHPLYTTTIAMVYFAGVCYNNYLVLILNTVIFIPMMVYRAKQEEKELSVYVAGYEEYMSRVGRLFPRLK